MASPEPEPTASVPADLASVSERAAEDLAHTVETSLETRSSLVLPPLKRWGAGYLAVLFLAQFVISIATLAPSTYSLAIRVQAMSPADKDTMLALVLMDHALRQRAQNGDVRVATPRIAGPQR